MGEVREGKGEDLGGALLGRELQMEKQEAESRLHPLSLLCLLGLRTGLSGGALYNLGQAR